MRINPVQAVLASAVILCAAGVSELLRPRELLASTQPPPDLERVIPKDFGQWHLVPNVGLVTPSEAGGYLEREPSSRIYSQEVARGYADAAGNTVMFLIAYGPVQNYRLKSHLPEMCYNAAGFRVSTKTVNELSYQPGAAPITVSRLIAQKERRY